MKIHVFISLEATDWNDYSDIDCLCCEDHHNASVHEAGTDEIVEEHWDVSSESIDRDFNVCEEDITKEDIPTYGGIMLTRSHLKLTELGCCFYFFYFYGRHFMEFQQQL